MDKGKRYSLRLAVLTVFCLCGIHSSEDHKSVTIFHVIDNSLWGEIDGSGLQGEFPCDNIKCHLETSEQRAGTSLFDGVVKKFKSNSRNEVSTTVGLYNIHTWNMISKWPHQPATCALATDLSMAESEESQGRFQRLFEGSFPFFDGNSTTSPSSSVPRVYYHGRFKDSSYLFLTKPFDHLIKAAVFVASTCHKGPRTTNREHLVSLVEAQFRVDSLGKCHPTAKGPEGITLSSSTDVMENLILKRNAISNYLFYLAFENTIEPGYVTEKVYDALIAGVVPIYLGDSVFCKQLIPFARAVIYLQDFGNDVEKLVIYMKYLSLNETAYEVMATYDVHIVYWKKSFLIYNISCFNF